MVFGSCSRSSAAPPLLSGVCRADKREARRQEGCPSKARQRVIEVVLAAVELKFGLWYNTGREVMPVAQGKAYIFRSG